MADAGIPKILAGAILAFAGAMSFAQNTPFASTPSGHLVVSNASNREMIAFVVAYTTKGSDGHESTPVGPGMQFDFYFKPHRLPPYEVMDLTDYVTPADGETLTFTKAKLVFVQYADGSIWGDATAGKEMLDRRVVTKAFYQSLIASYKQDGEQAFLDRLEAEHKNSDIRLRLRAGSLLHNQQQAGTQAVIDTLNQRIAAANARTF